MEKEQTIELLNYVLNKTAEILCINKSVNASFAIWAAALPTDPMPADAFVIMSTDAPLTIKATSLGDLAKKPFIMIKNLSDVNACKYEVTFIGLKKAVPGALLVEDDENMEVVDKVS